MNKFQPDIVMEQRAREQGNLKHGDQEHLAQQHLDQQQRNRRARNLLIAKTVGFVLIPLVASLVAVYVML